MVKELQILAVILVAVILMLIVVFLMFVWVIVMLVMVEIKMIMILLIYGIDDENDAWHGIVDFDFSFIYINLFIVIYYLFVIFLTQINDLCDIYDLFNIFSSSTSCKRNLQYKDLSKERFFWIQSFSWRI